MIAAIAPNDSKERFTGLGRAGDRRRPRASRTARPSWSATGSRSGRAASWWRPARRRRCRRSPDSHATPYLTNETVFDLAALARAPLVIGGGPIGLELAQAFRRLGARGDGAGSRAAARARGSRMRRRRARCARARGRRHPQPTSRSCASRRPGAKSERSSCATADGEQRDRRAAICWSRPAGAANADGLASRTPASPTTAAASRSTRGCKTTNKRVYAIGDVAGGLQFTHARQLPRRPGDPERAVPAAGVDGRRRPDPAGDLHRSRARPCRPDRGRGAGGARIAIAGAALALSRERPGPGRARDRRATSRW